MNNTTIILLEMIQENINTAIEFKQLAENYKGKSAGIALSLSLLKCINKNQFNYLNEKIHTNERIDLNHLYSLEDLNMNICEFCNQHYYLNEDNNEHFCSLECSNQYNHENSKCNCEHCKKSYIAYESDAQCRDTYCSAYCEDVGDNGYTENHE